MGQPDLSIDIESERALAACAGELARRWREHPPESLVVGLEGELGAGKTTFVRALLRGLGHTGRVPSPTYTLLEHYRVGELTVVHLDLYRLAEAQEFEYLGVRDWLAEPGTWLLVEWPGRAPQLADRADLTIGFAIGTAERRRLHFSARSERGRALVESLDEIDSSYST